jgi:hypothetical protein
MRLGMALLRVDQIREFERIADEENRRVVAY